MSETVGDRIKTMIVDRLFLKVAPEDIDDNKSLINDYGVDSVCLLELVVGLEEEFGIQVGDSEFRVANFETVTALTAFVESKLP